MQWFKSILDIYLASNQFLPAPLQQTLEQKIGQRLPSFLTISFTILYSSIGPSKTSSSCT